MRSSPRPRSSTSSCSAWTRGHPSCPALVLAATALVGCFEEPVVQPHLGSWPAEYSFAVEPRVLVAPRGDTVTADLETGAPLGALRLDDAPEGVEVLGLDLCCATGGGTIGFAIEPEAPVGNYEVHFRVTDGSLTGWARMQISVVEDQTSSALPLASVVVAGSHPSGISINPSGRWAWVPNKNSDSITLIDLDVHRSEGDWDVHPDGQRQIPNPGDGPVDVAFAADGAGYIANRYSDLLTRRPLIPGATALDVTVAEGPSAVAIDSDVALAYVAAWDANEVTMVDLASHEVIGSISAGTAPSDIEVAADGMVYVTNWGSDHVSIIDPEIPAVVDTIPVGARPMAITLSSDGTLAFVVNSGSDDVSIIDLATRTVTRTVPVGRAPSDVAVTEDGTRAFVANAEDDDVLLLDLVNHRVVGSLVAGDNPVALAIRPDGAFLYVVNEWGDDVYVFDLAEPTGASTHR